MSLVRKAITRVQATLIIAVIVVAALVGVGYTYYVSLPSSTTTTTAPPASTMVDTLSLDDCNWPNIGDLNNLYAVFIEPWPDWLAYTVYQSLINMNVTAEYQARTIQWLPGLADNWTVSNDYRVYTFNLKHGVKFSNGDPFNAYQVWTEMYGFYYLSGNSSAWLEGGYSLFDMSPVQFGPATIALLTASGLINPSQAALNIMMNSSWPIYVTGPYQIVFRMPSPFLWLLGMFYGAGDTIGAMFDTQYVLENGGFGTPTSFNSYFNQHPIPGTGPYMFSKMAELSYVEFDQNPNYWGANLTAAQIAGDRLLDPGHAKHVIVYYKPDDVTRWTDLSSGHVQVSCIQAPDWNLVTTNPQTYSYFQNPPWPASFAYLGLNTQLYPTNVREYRQAIVHAINYTDISQKAYLGKTLPMVGPEWPIEKLYYNTGNLAPYTYNLTLAEQYLAQAEAKYPNITSVPLLMKVPAGSAAGINSAQVIQADLAQLNITMNIEVISLSAIYAGYGSYQTNLANAATNGQIQNWGVLWSGEFTPLDNYIFFASKESFWGNTATYSSPVVENAIANCETSTNVTYIQSQLRAADAQIYYDAPYIWLGVMLLPGASGGSDVWKTSVVTGFVMDPLFSGDNALPMFNTVTFAPGYTSP